MKGEIREEIAHLYFFVPTGGGGGGWGYKSRDHHQGGRHHRGQGQGRNQKKMPEGVDPNNPTVIKFQMFARQGKIIRKEGYREKCVFFLRELDSKHDKHERIFKLSRDITVESKRTIFLLHRITR